jgi:hypothetical protein
MFNWLKKLLIKAYTPKCECCSNTVKLPPGSLNGYDTINLGDKTAEAEIIKGMMSGGVDFVLMSVEDDDSVTLTIEGEKADEIAQDIQSKYPIEEEKDESG